MFNEKLSIRAVFSLRTDSVVHNPGYFSYLLVRFELKGGIRMNRFSQYVHESF